MAPVPTPICATAFSSCPTTASCWRARPTPSLTGNISVALVRLLANGSPDPAFTADGRVTLDDGISYTTPEVSDVAYDAGRGRLVVAATTTGLAAAEYGTLLAVTASGADDSSFSGDGQRTLRFSRYG